MNFLGVERSMRGGEPSFWKWAFQYDLRDATSNASTSNKTKSKSKAKRTSFRLCREVEEPLNGELHLILDHVQEGALP